MRCHACAAENPSVARFCFACGTRLEGAAGDAALPGASTAVTDPELLVERTLHEHDGPRPALDTAPFTGSHLRTARPPAGEGQRLAAPVRYGDAAPPTRVGEASDTLFDLPPLVGVIDPSAERAVAPSAGPSGAAGGEPMVLSRPPRIEQDAGDWGEGLRDLGASPRRSLGGDDSLTFELGRARRVIWTERALWALIVLFLGGAVYFLVAGLRAGRTPPRPAPAPSSRVTPVAPFSTAARDAPAGAGAA